jgi:hypothetical protein
MSHDKNSVEDGSSKYISWSSVLWRRLVMWQDTNMSEDLAAFIYIMKEDSKVIRNVGILPQHYTKSQPTRLRLESSSLWKSQISGNKMTDVD